MHQNVTKYLTWMTVCNITWTLHSKKPQHRCFSLHCCKYKNNEQYPTSYVTTSCALTSWCCVLHSSHTCCEGCSEKTHTAGQRGRAPWLTGFLRPHLPQTQERFISRTLFTNICTGTVCFLNKVSTRTKNIINAVAYIHRKWSWKTFSGYNVKSNLHQDISRPK